MIAKLRHMISSPPNKAQRTRRSRQRQRGQSLVEFALVMPMLILFIMGTVDFGRALFTYAQASSQLRQALRLAAVIGYDTSATATYRDCDQMRAVARNVFFAEQPIPTTIEYYIAPTSWNTSTNAWSVLNDWNGSAFVNPDTCAETGGADVGPTGLKNGDILRITINPSVRMITPVFPQTLTFTLSGQRTIVNSIQLTSLPRCGDRICQTGEDSTSCAADCTSASVNTILIINPGAGTILAGNTATSITISMSIADTYAFSSDNGATWSAFSGSSCTTCTYTWTTPLPGVATDYTLKAKTSAGIVSGGVTVTVSPNTPPTISSITPTGGATVTPGGNETITVVATDTEQAANTLTVSIVPSVGGAISGGSWSGGTYTATWAVPAGSGSATIAVSVTDSGPLTTTSNASVTLGACGTNCQPSASVACPSGVCTGLKNTVSIPISTSDGNGGTHTVSIAMIPNGSFTSCAAIGTWTSVGSGAPGSFSYSWDTASGSYPNATYNVCAKVVDNSGQANDTYITPAAVQMVVANPTSYHVSALTGLGTVTQTTGGGATSKWTSSATITVMRDDGVVLANATVTFALTVTSSNSQIGTFSFTCTTDSSGQCTVAKTLLGGNDTVTNWAVSNITYSGSPSLTYNSGANVVSNVVVNIP